MSDRSRLLVMAALLVGLTLGALAPVVGTGFLSYDGDQYVTGNPHVQQGVSVSSLRWAFTATRAANWHPLTWVSHMLDWRSYGDRAWGHHLTSLILHVASALLLFLVLHAMTGSVGRSGFVAALFAVHPLHVESVAWVAERKDVLGGLLWMLTTAAYVGWVRRPRATRYGLVVLAFAAGLAAKPMLVRLPFTLLLLDVWPLARWRGSWQEIRRPLREKLPLFVLSAASSAVTLLAQRRGGAIASLASYPLAIRLENSVVSYVVYLGRTIVPSGLSFFYPHGHESSPLWQVVGSTLLLLAITGAAYPDTRTGSAKAAAGMGRTLETAGLKEALQAKVESPGWEKVEKRCLSCANCTLVCPTCFCSTIEDTTDLAGDVSERWRRWDSCFTLDFSYIHGGSVRRSGASRYRQWLTHKLASWVDQFGESGCVGCGRCITWCPVGIDLTEEVHRLREGGPVHAARSRGAGQASLHGQRPSISDRRGAAP